MSVTVLWHLDDEFYNVRVPKGMKTISQGAMRMRHKIYNVDGVDWRYHVVLTLNPEELKKYKNGIDSSILKKYFTEVKKIFPNEIHFWKYEEGRESERPHFHLLFDLKENLKDKQKEIENVVGIGDLGEFVENQKKYDMNKAKNDIEIIMGYFNYKVWGKGIAHTRLIKNELELSQQVEKDIAKRTGTMGFKENKRKYGFSKGVKVKKVVKEKVYEWCGSTTIEEGMIWLESTKDNFIAHFDKISYSGIIVYDRTVEDLEGYKKKCEGKKQRLIELKQKRVDGDNE